MYVASAAGLLQSVSMEFNFREFTNFGLIYLAILLKIWFIYQQFNAINMIERTVVIVCMKNEERLRLCFDFMLHCQ